MSHTVASRLLKGALANGFGLLVIVVNQLLSVPFLLSFWGTNLYGEWLLLSAIPAYLSISDLGFGTVAANEMSMLVAKGDRKSALEVFQSVFVIIGIISLSLILLLLVIIWKIPFESWFHLTVLTHTAIVQVVILWVFIAFMGLQDSLLEAGFRCDGNFAMGTFFLNLRYLLETLSLIAVVYLGAHPVIAAASIASVRLCGFIALRLLLKRKSPWVVYGFSKASFLDVKRLASPAIAFMAIPFGNALSLQGMVLAVGVVIGPAAVVVFSVTRTVSRIVSQFIISINGSVRPEISMAYGKGDLGLVGKLHRMSSQFSLWLASAIIMVLLLTGGWLIRIWTHGKIEIDYALFSLMMLVTLASSFWYASSVVLMAVNRHQKMAVVYLVGTSISLLLALLLMPKWGLNGAAVSLLAVDMIMTAYVISASLSLTGGSLSSFVKQIVTPPSLGGVFKLGNYLH